MEDKDPLSLANELDSMDRDLTSKEADFLESVLKTLRAGKPLAPKDEGRLELLHEKYLGAKDAKEEDNDDEEQADEDEDDLA